MYPNKLFDKIIGNSENYSLAQRIFNFTLLSGILLNFYALFTNFFLKPRYLMIFFEIFGIIFFTFIYFYSLKTKKHKTPAIISFIFLIFIFIPNLWINGGGLNNSFQIFIGLVTFTIAFVLHGKLKTYFLFLFTLVIIGMVIFEYEYPEYVHYFPDRKSRFVDYLVNIPIAVLFMALLTSFNYNQVLRLNKKLVSVNKSLEKSNQDIIIQKEELEQTLVELRNTQKLLVESEKNASLGLLTAGISHELNTPLGICIQAVSGISYKTSKISKLLKENKLSNLELINYLEFTHKSASIVNKNLQRASELITTFKQISGEQAEEDKKEFLVKSYFKDVIFSLNSKFEHKKIKIRIVCDENLTFKGTPAVFAQILTNLLVNSIIHGFKDTDTGQILIIIDKLNGILKINYRDNGIGIKKEWHSKIFDPFFTTNQKCGTGLGMHIVYNLITRKLKGSVNIDSKENSGFTCYIEIPEQ